MRYREREKEALTRLGGINMHTAKLLTWRVRSVNTFERRAREKRKIQALTYLPRQGPPLELPPIDRTTSRTI